MYRGSGEGHFTDYLEALAVSNEPPPDQRVEAVLTALWRLIQAELRRRGLWLRQPGYLGVYGVSSWSQATQPPDIFRSEAWELVAECFRYIFLDRYAYLVRQLQAGANVEGLVRRNVRNFVHDTQKKHDPLGFRVFSVLRKAALELINTGRLFVLDGDERLRNITLVGFDPAIDGPTEAEEAEIRARLTELVPAWNDQLLPDLLTAQGRGLVELQETARGLFQQLPQQHVALFRFRDLIEPIKLDVRHRWGALFDTEQGESAFEEGEEPGLLRLVRRVQPDTSLAERESFAFLLRCVDQHLAAADLKPKVREHLERLWQFLSLYASHPETRKVPSRRALAEQLGIPRNSMGALYDQLREFSRLCQESGEATTAPEPPDEAAQKGSTMVDDETKLASLSAHLNRAAILRHQRFLAEGDAQEGAARPLETGDLLRRPETATLGVDWLVLHAEEAGVETLWLVPVDDAPLFTSADVDIPASEGGPMTLRCGLALQVPSQALSAEHRYATLEPAHLERVRACWRASRSHGNEDVPNADPEVDFWLSDAVLPARAALERAVGASATVHPFPAPSKTAAQGSRAWQQRLAWAAAVLLTVSLGLLSTVIGQHNQLGELRHRWLQSTGDAMAIYGLERTDLPLPSVTRSLDDTFPVVVRQGELTLSIKVEEASEPYRIDLVDAKHKRQERLHAVSDGHAEILFRLTGVEPGTRLELQVFRLRDATRTATYDLELIAPSTE